VSQSTIGREDARSCPTCKDKKMHAEELWTGDSFKARAFRTILTPASWLYAVGWQGYLASYRLGLKQPKHPHSPIICIGNLLVGGTGKTPTTLHIAEVLTNSNHKLVISCSGYGSSASEAARIAPAGPLKASEWGDEAALIRSIRPDTPLIVGRRRVLAAELCNQSFPDSILLMDDGFQHLPLKKDLTILIDPSQKNRRCLPAGPYREPPGNRKRADLVIPGEFWFVTRKLSFHGQNGTPRALQGDVDVLCALGRPQGFIDALQNAGLNPRTLRTLPDHDRLSDGNLLLGLGTRSIVVTGKDWVKLRERRDIGDFDIAIASHEVTIEPEGVFQEWLQSRLNGIAHKET
jgi:tetraacyldisaccharide 4'-kinase